MKKSYGGAEHPHIYSAARLGVEAHERLRHNFTVVGRDRIPKTGGGVAAYSHRHGYDPVVVGAAYTRMLYAMGKKEVWTDQYDFKIPLLGVMNAGTLATFFGAFPVDRENPSHETFRHADNLVAEGKVVSMAPEMTRFEDEELRTVRGIELGHLYEGAGTLVVRNEAFISPVGVKVLMTDHKGEDKITKIAVVIGGPIRERPEHKALPKKERVAIIMRRLHDYLQEMHYEADRLAA